MEFLRSICTELNLEFEVFEMVAGHPIGIARWNGTDPSLPSILLNSHTDVVPVDESLWHTDPFAAEMDEAGNIYARGTQDMKCVTIQYLEAIRRLKQLGVEQLKRNIILTFVPDEEIGSKQAFELFIDSEKFRSLNAGVALDEGLASPDESFSVFFGERLPWWVNIRATGPTGHGSRFIEKTAVEKIVWQLDISLANFADALLL